MQLTIYGSIEAGRITVNADGLRVVLTKTDAGWVPSSADAMAAVSKSTQRELGELLVLLSGGPTGPAPLRAVSS